MCTWASAIYWNMGSFSGSIYLKETNSPQAACYQHPLVVNISSTRGEVSWTPHLFGDFCLPWSLVGVVHLFCCCPFTLLLEDMGNSPVMASKYCLTEDSQLFLALTVFLPTLLWCPLSLGRRVIKRILFSSAHWPVIGFLYQSLCIAKKELLWSRLKNVLIYWYKIRT